MSANMVIKRAGENIYMGDAIRIDGDVAFRLSSLSQKLDGAAAFNAKKGEDIEVILPNAIFNVEE
jgi:hypothetical protein